MTWHRPVRIVVGVIACASAAAAYVTSTRRPPSAPRRPWSASTRRPCSRARRRSSSRCAEARKPSKCGPTARLHYEDGSTRQYGVQVSVRKRGGRDFVVTAEGGAAGKEGEELELSGAVKLPASDGFELECRGRDLQPGDRAWCSAPGDVSFLKGRLSGSSKGMNYDTNTEMLSLLANPDVRLTPDEAERAENDGMEFRAGTARLDRIAHLLSLEGGLGDRRRPGPHRGVRRGATVRGRAACHVRRAARRRPRDRRTGRSQDDRAGHGSGLRRGRRRPSSARCCAGRRWSSRRRAAGGPHRRFAAACWTCRSTRTGS